MKEIVVGVDGSETSGQALAWAVEEGTIEHRPVRAVLAWTLFDQHLAQPSDRYDPAYGDADAARALDAYVVGAIGAERAADVRRTVLCDLPAPALLDASAGAALLVVGARGLGGFRGLLLGSVSSHCAHHARCPVAIVRPGPGSATEVGMQRIVVGVDGSRAAQRALTWAIEEARLRGAALEVVHGWHPPYVGAHPYAAALDVTAFEEAARQTLDGAVAGQDVAGLAAPPERLLVLGGGASAILDTAKGADLVVVGSRGRGGFAGLLLGSVSHQVAHHATCPVVIVPTGE